MISRPPGLCRSTPSKPRAHRQTRRSLAPDCSRSCSRPGIRKQRTLSAIRPLNETLHQSPAAASGSYLQGVFTHPGSPPVSAISPTPGHRRDGSDQLAAGPSKMRGRRAAALGASAACKEHGGRATRALCGANVHLCVRLGWSHRESYLEGQTDNHNNALLQHRSAGGERFD
jgi:hypothetical protein